MRRLFLLLVICFPLVVVAQPQPRQRIDRMPPRFMPGSQGAMAEGAIKSAMEQLANDRKIFDRDIEVLRYLRLAEEALTDPMQPNNAIQKAIDNVEKAKSVPPQPIDFTVLQGVIKVSKELESARLSPMGADFGRLRSILRSEAIGPAARLVARNGAKLQEETAAWIRIQEMIISHLRQLSDITGDSLRAASQ